MRKVLVVEDEFSINDILRFSLEEEGFKALGVYNCKDARLGDEKGSSIIETIFGVGYVMRFGYEK